MRKILVSTLGLYVLLSCATAQSVGKKTEAKGSAASKSQVSKKVNKKIKDYDKVITKDAVTDDGLFKVHVIGEKYYFEIPMKHLNRDMLLVSRFAKLPSNLGGGYVNAGTKTNTRMINWERFKDKILIKEITSSAVATDSLPINISVKSNNYEPTLYAFDIAAFSKDSSAWY